MTIIVHGFSPVKESAKGSSFRWLYVSSPSKKINGSFVCRAYLPISLDYTPLIGEGLEVNGNFHDGVFFVKEIIKEY